jgi:hypothetical protein
MQQYGDIKILYRYKHNNLHAAVVEYFGERYTFIRGLSRLREYDIHDGIGGVLKEEETMSNALKIKISIFLLQDEPSGYESRISRHNEAQEDKIYMNDPLDW